MKNTEPAGAPATRRRTSPEDYFDAAMDLLAAGGADALTIAAVCTRLEVTKGSFYYHFRRWDDFVGRLLASWAASQTEAIIEVAGAEANLESQMDLLVEFASNLPHRAEAAIRAWGRSQPRVRTAVAQVDARRQNYLAEVYDCVIQDRARAELLAAGAMALLVGTQQLHDDPSSEQLRTLLTEFRKLLAA